MIGTPAEMMPQLLAAADGGPVAIVFGPEPHGLNNEEIGRCVWAQLIFGCQAPDAGNAEILHLDHREPPSVALFDRPRLGQMAEHLGNEERIAFRLFPHCTDESLVFFLRHPGEVLSRTRIYEQVWEEQYDGLSNIVDVYIRRLRQHIDEGAALPLIHTVRGAGYRITASGE